MVCSKSQVPSGHLHPLSVQHSPLVGLTSGSSGNNSGQIPGSALITPLWSLNPWGWRPLQAFSLQSQSSRLLTQAPTGALLLWSSVPCLLAFLCFSLSLACVTHIWYHPQSIFQYAAGTNLQNGADVAPAAPLLELSPPLRVIGNCLPPLPGSQSVPWCYQGCLTGHCLSGTALPGTPYYHSDLAFKW